MNNKDVNTVEEFEDDRIPVDIEELPLGVAEKFLIGIGATAYVLKDKYPDLQLTLQKKYFHISGAVNEEEACEYYSSLPVVEKLSCIFECSRGKIEVSQHHYMQEYVIYYDEHEHDFYDDVAHTLDKFVIPFNISLTPAAESSIEPMFEVEFNPDEIVDFE